MSKTISQYLAHIILIVGVLLMVVPIWIIFASSTHDNGTILSQGMHWGLGDKFLENYDKNELNPYWSNKQSKHSKKSTKYFKKMVEK